MEQYLQETKPSWVKTLLIEAARIVICTLIAQLAVSLMFNLYTGSLDKDKDFFTLYGILAYAIYFILHCISWRVTKSHGVFIVSHIRDRAFDLKIIDIAYAKRYALYNILVVFVILLAQLAIYYISDVTHALSYSYLQTIPGLFFLPFCMVHLLMENKIIALLVMFLIYAITYLLLLHRFIRSVERKLSSRKGLRAS